MSPRHTHGTQWYVCGALTDCFCLMEYGHKRDRSMSSQHSNISADIRECVVYLPCMSSSLERGGPQVSNRDLKAYLIYHVNIPVSHTTFSQLHARRSNLSAAGGWVKTFFAAHVDCYARGSVDSGSQDTVPLVFRFPLRLPPLISAIPAALSYRGGRTRTGQEVKLLYTYARRKNVGWR